MKDKTKGVPIVEFVGLRSKMYNYVQNDEITCKKAKGIKQNIVKKVIKHEDYKKILFNNNQMYHKMKTIRRKIVKFIRWKSTKNLFHLLMIKDIFTIMELRVLLMVIFKLKHKMCSTRYQLTSNVL